MPNKNTNIKLYDLARVIRTKNAGPFKLTIDIFFDDQKIYKKIKELGILNPELIAKVYNIQTSMIQGIYFVDLVLGVKITMIKPVASDDIKTTDMFGAQQHAPLLSIEIKEDVLKDT